MSKLLKEYNKWAVVNSILKKYNGKENKKNYIYVQRSISTYLLEKDNNLETSTDYIVEHLGRKGIVINPADLKKIEALDMSLDYQLTPSFSIEIDMKGTSAKVRIGAYKGKYTRETISQLRQKASDETIAVLLMRYASYESGHFWSIPLEAYDYLYRSGFEMECFASPLNHYLPKYYSMFPDLDVTFGSLGNFWSQFLVSKDERFVINPPFSYPMIRRVAEFCINRSTSGRNTTILLYGPNWPGAGIPESYASVVAAYPVSGVREIPEKKHYIYDYTTGSKVPAVYSAKIILVSNFDSQKWVDEILDKFVSEVSVPTLFMDE